MSDPILERMLWHKTDLCYKAPETLQTGSPETELVYRLLSDETVIESIKSGQVLDHQAWRGLRKGQKS